MTQLFKTYLEMAVNPESSVAHKLTATIPKELGCTYDGKPYSVRELLLNTNIESTTLIQSEAHKTAVKGSEPSICLRNALRILKMPSKVMPVTFGEAGAYAPEVAEGTDIPIQNQDYDSVSFTAVKYGGRPLISNEMVDDSMFDVIEMEIGKVGRSIENRLNRNGIDEMIDTITAEVDTAETGTAQGVEALIDASATVRAAGFNPDTAILHPEAAAILGKEYVPSNYHMGEGVAKTGLLTRLVGLDLYTCGVVDNATATWGYAANAELGIIVFDSTAAAAIGMRRDISVEKYNDPVKDLLGMSVLARFDVQVINPAAACVVEF